MVKVEDIQQYGKEQIETVVASATTLQNGLQAIASAYGDYTKKSFEDTKSFVEKLSGVKLAGQGDRSADRICEVRLRDVRRRVAEDRRALYRSRQADLQAAGRHRGEVHPGRCPPISCALAAACICGMSADVGAACRNQKPGLVWPGFFLFWMCGDYFATRGNAALSNPTELINLHWIAEPGVGPSASSFWPIFARLRRASVGPIFELSVQLMGRAGRERRSGGRVRELRDDSGRRTSPGRDPVSCGDVEHLCHAATSFQI